MPQPIQAMKSRPLGKDEVHFLLDQIAKQKIITSRAINATNNRLKEDAWRAIAKEFNVMAGETRRPEQLRLKWENLKKTARKRSAMIRENNLKDDRHKLYIPRDETLDRVEALLRRTGKDERSVDRQKSPTTIEVVPDLLTWRHVENASPSSSNIEIASPSPSQAEEGNDPLTSSGDGSGVESEANSTPKKSILNKPTTSSLNKRRRLVDEIKKAQRDKEMAMAAYFRAKTEKVQLENKKLKLEIEQFKKSL